MVRRKEPASYFKRPTCPPHVPFTGSVPLRTPLDHMPLYSPILPMWSPPETHSTTFCSLRMARMGTELDDCPLKRGMTSTPINPVCLRVLLQQPFCPRFLPRLNGSSARLLASLSTYATNHIAYAHNVLSTASGAVRPALLSILDASAISSRPGTYQRARGRELCQRATLDSRIAAHAIV